MANLINKAAVRKMALGISQEERNGKFRRVGASFFEQIESATRKAVKNAVRAHPSVGMTLK